MGCLVQNGIASGKVGKCSENFSLACGLMCPLRIHD